MEIELYLKQRKELVDDALDRFLPPKKTYPDIIHDSIRYSIFAGGKRLRPILTLAVGDVYHQDLSLFLPAACALEMIHCYSLIHDDLPAMDDDEYRRGKLTNHKVYGEAMAVLAGDALLTMAFDVLSWDSVIDPQVTLKVIQEIAFASGTRGMIGGQVVDLKSEGRPVGAETLDYIHRKKTGALINASVRVGGIIAGAAEAELERLTRYGECLGLAFQIIDDILDIEGEEEKLGKKTGMDTWKEKATYPGIHGLSAAKEKVKELYNESLRAVEVFEARGEVLKILAHFLVNRDY
ncbi:polyprenyl synthetase family protein [Candidatus Contubernalis alkaliaceticus]|uniref:polyprenyl synthetase family protein n=1 Tax=Candidatus Contubernalis alkaliaceticus TaxID=338645 RepID=UPI001F4C1D96|nr:farnesyl diphosphate synthase [Candidatus Contubernalis alkalaceticus]UNC92543.1 polyprenyl synthetase family protein [Candidatus Contubernalis alkalaceticus]